MNLGRLLEEKAKIHPKRKAIFYEGKTIRFEELNKHVNRVANGLKSLGIEKGDRIAIMLPNIPEFVYTFFACQKLGAVAVPFNTMYKGGEIFYILKDCNAKAIITLKSNVPLINEIKSDLPHLQFIITTGERELTFADPDSTFFFQGILSKGIFRDIDDAYQRLGNVFSRVLMALGLEKVWYKHRGSLRVGGRKLAGFSFFDIEASYFFHLVCFLTPFDPQDFFSVIWVPPEVRDRVLEPLTSVQEELGRLPSVEEMSDKILDAVSKEFGSGFQRGDLTRDEKIAYEQYRAVAKRK